MKRLTIITFILVIGLTGCSTHFLRIEDDMLHVYLKKPKAKIVLFAFSTDGYEHHTAVKKDRKTWEIVVSPNAEFRYFYIIDGSVFLPSCKLTERDDFGSEICIFETGI
jgi:hypothetical protein